MLAHQPVLIVSKNLAETPPVLLFIKTYKVMKIFFVSPPLPGKGVEKLLMIMKLTVAFSILCLMQISATVYSQGTRFNLHVEDEQIVNVLKNIEESSNFRFFYLREQVDVERRVSVKADNATVETILGDLFKGQGVKFEVLENDLILIRPENQAVSPPATYIQQQGKTVSGKVTDEEGEPVPGVTITLKGTTTGTITDMDGNFSLSGVQDDATLVFTFVGMTTREIPIGDQNFFEIVMQEDVLGLDEVVVVGYGVTKKVNLTGSVATIKTDDLENIPVAKLSNAVGGRLAGVFTQQRTGAPGASTEMVVRTTGSWNSTPPIFVIDGVVTDQYAFDLLDPSEVEDITVLKDAASAAIYGSRSSGGVFLITTKKGQKGKPVFDFKSSYSFEEPTKIIDVTTAVELAGLVNFIHQDNPSFFYYWDQDEIDHIKTINNGDGYSYLDEYWKNPTTTQYNLNVSGGSDRIRYFAGGSVVDQTGVLENLTYKKYNLRANMTMDVTDNFQTFIQFSSSNTTQDKVTFDTRFDVSDLFGKLLFWQPDHRPLTSDGKPIYYGWLGHLGEFTSGNSGYNRNENQFVNVIMRGEYTFPMVQGLKASFQYAYNTDNFLNKRFLKKHKLYEVETRGAHNHIWTDNIIREVYSSWPNRESIEKVHSLNKYQQLNTQLNYNREFGEHSVDALFVYEVSESAYESFYGGRENFPIIIKDQWFATSSIREDSYVGGNENENGRSSYIGQLGYNYADKYLVNISARYDGSMKFAPDKRWGLFPSLSAAWRISNESFFSSNWVEYLKMRGSIGMTGNDAVGGWNWQESYQAGSSAYYGAPPARYPGIRYRGLVNPDITWEKSRSYNIGIDLITKNGIGVTADYWFKNTYDILGNRILSLPTSFGASLPAENYGEMESKGVELEISYNKKFGNFDFNAKGVIAYATNKVIKQDYPENADDYAIPVGRTSSYVVGYKYDKIIRTQADLDALPEDFLVFSRTPKLGMMIYEDLSGPDDEPDGKIDGYDQTVLDKQGASPVSYGLTLGGSWKGFSVSALFQGLAGGKRWADWRMREPLEWNRVSTIWLDHWSPENTDAKYPLIQSYNDWATYRVNSDFWLYNSGFVRLKNLNVGYSFPKNLVGSLGLDDVNLFFNGTNLFFLSQFDFFDPEVNGSDSYPNMKTYTFGVNVKF